MSESTGTITSDDVASSRATLATETIVAAAAFLVMCPVVLVRSPRLMEPDDYAYRASIIALSQGHVLLTNAQYFALKTQLSVHGGPGIVQWVHLKMASGSVKGTLDIRFSR